MDSIGTLVTKHKEFRTRSTYYESFLTVRTLRPEGYPALFR